jgi:DNA-binding response OmpR family regulator
MRVLVVEDYEPVRRAVGKGLAEAGFDVTIETEGVRALNLILAETFEVVILDLMLPKLDGLTILDRIRKSGIGTHILVLTAKDAVEDRVRGLNLGADDYLVKPFSFDELLARVRALIRRRFDEKQPTIWIGDMAIDTISRQVSRRGLAIELTAREYALLEYLALRAGQVVTRRDVWDHVYEFHNDALSNVVDVYIGYLRRKIEQPGLCKLIHTRRGHGYVLGEEP